MAAWIAGSARIRANTNATKPASAPASMPRATSCRSMSRAGSVAGEAEEVPRVVDELVDLRAAERRHRALVDADEVVQREGEGRGAGEPPDGPGQRQDDRRGGGAGRGKGGHVASSGIVRPVRGGACVTAPCLTHPPGRAHSGATVLEFHQLPYAVTLQGTLRAGPDPVNDLSDRWPARPRWRARSRRRPAPAPRRTAATARSPWSRTRSGPRFRPPTGSRRRRR